MRFLSFAVVLGTASLLSIAPMAWAVDPANVNANAVECGYEPPRGSNGDTPDDALLRQLMTCLWQQPARPGIAGPVQVRLDGIERAASRRWGEPSDIGLGYLHTRVWPVTAHYRRQSEQLGQLSVEEGRAAFNCFVNTSRQWQCMLVERLPDPATQTVAR